MTSPTPTGRPLRGLLETDPVVATAGVSLLAEALRDQAVPVTVAVHGGDPFALAVGGHGANHPPGL